MSDANGSAKSEAEQKRAESLEAREKAAADQVAADRAAAEKAPANPAAADKAPANEVVADEPAADNAAADQVAAEKLAAEMAGLPAWWDVNLKKGSSWFDRLVRLWSGDTQYEFDAANQRAGIQQDLEVRYSLLEGATKRLKRSVQYSQAWPIAEKNHRNFHLLPLSIWQMATIDVFVEKAQSVLDTRSRQNGVYALCMIGLTVVIMGLAFLYAYTAFVAPNAQDPSKTKDHIDPFFRVFTFLGRAALLGVILGVAYFFSSLARAFLHECTILANRRHSVRFGRLYLHLKVSSAQSESELAKTIDSLNVVELQQCFGWNLETSTAFKDINPQAMTTGLFGQLLESLRQVSEKGKASEATRQLAETTSGRNGETPR